MSTIEFNSIQIPICRNLSIFSSSGKCKIIFSNYIFMKKMNVWSDISSLSFVVVVLVVFFLFIVVQYPKISRFFSEEENFSLLGLFYIYLTSLHFVSMFIWRNMIRFYQEMRLEQKYCNRCEINFHIFPETNSFAHSMVFFWLVPHNFSKNNLFSWWWWWWR